MNSAVDWTNAGDGPLYAGDPGGESHESETGKEAEKNETTPFGNREARMRKHKCHFSRTDPFMVGAAMLLLGGAVFLAPRTNTFSLADGTRVRIALPGPFGTLHNSVYRIIVELGDTPAQTVTLRSDYGHGLIFAAFPLDDDALYCIYDCDVVLRLIKIDTRRSFRPFQARSALNWIVSSSPFMVSQGNCDDWRAMLGYVKRVGPSEYRRCSIPTLDVGPAKLYADRKFLVPRMEQQIDAMFGGKSRFYESGKD
jgi:hypothetical protein